jgi:anti-sigma B factor antagonist
MAELAGGDQAARVLIDMRSDPTGAPVVTLTGELDMSNADALQNALAAITARRPQRLIFELSGLRFIDSAGIAVLLGAAAEIDAVHVRDPSPTVRRVLELTGLDDVLAIEP